MWLQAYLKKINKRIVSVIVSTINLNPMFLYNLVLYKTFCAKYSKIV